MLSGRGAGASDVSLGRAGAEVVVDVSTIGEVCTGAAGSSDGFSGAATHCLHR